jgi:ABC-type transport system involved in multi-copper enzyme maturation permease subunit
VQIFWESNNKWIILGMSILFLILAGVIGVSIISLSANADSLHGKVQTLQQIGEVRKILNFISYFSWRTLENPNDTNVRDLLNKYISEFYQYSGTTYE